MRIGLAYVVRDPTAAQCLLRPSRIMYVASIVNVVHGVANECMCMNQIRFVNDVP